MIDGRVGRSTSGIASVFPLCQCPRAPPIALSCGDVFARATVDRMSISSAQAKAWRLKRHALDGHSTPAVSAKLTVNDVVARVIAIRGWPSTSRDLAIAVRLDAPLAGAVDRDLEAGRLLRSYAFRGGSYLFTPEIAAETLAVRRVGRIWESARWQRQGGFTLDDWQPLRDAMREALADGPKTRAQLSAHLSSTPALAHLAHAALGAGADSLYKPLHWWGDLRFGPSVDGESTFELMSGAAGWTDVSDVDEAGRRAVARYLSSYGPATRDHLAYWLTESLGAPTRRVDQWIEALGDEVLHTSIDGVTHFIRARDLDDIEATVSSHSVRFIPAFDPWVMGPGSADPTIVPPLRRSLVSAGRNLVIREGVVCGTWSVRSSSVSVTWFSEMGPAPMTDLEAESQHLTRIQGMELVLDTRTAD